MSELETTSMSRLLGGLSEVQVVLFVLSAMVVGVALLSYFVVAPEYEKHLDKQYAAMVHQTTSTHHSLVKWKHDSAHLLRAASERRHTVDPHALGTSQKTDCGANEVRDGSEPADDAYRLFLARNVKDDFARRRKSEGDALRLAAADKMEMLRRRVQLRKLEEEINGALQETNATEPHRLSRSGHHSSRLVRRDSLGFTDERLQTIQEHSVDCNIELEMIAKSTDASAIKRALQNVHDVLSFYLSVDHRDMNKVTVFCNSLLAHDGLNHLRGFEVSTDPEIRELANQIIEKAVPAIWH